MREAQEEPKVTEFAGADGREAFLKELLAEISFCEKALTDYLNGKKSQFPRFYFISD
jgi:hypothetical protein